MFHDKASELQLLSQLLRPTKDSTNLLLGAAKAVWEKELYLWRNSHKFHFILWGPPGCGKTTLARLLGEVTQTPFVTLSAVQDGVKEIRLAVENYSHGLVFIDEIHRLNKAQQDTLLPILEHSQAWIIGATTESPKTALSPPILSRVRNIYIAPLKEIEINQALLNGLEYLKLKDLSLFTKRVNFEAHLKEVSIPKIARMSAGDLRLALNMFENIVHSENEEDELNVYKNSLKAFTSKNHYDYISAMIKSMRGSDPDAALFYGVTSLDKGEDPLFILRRCIIFASEDVGNADPGALALAVNAYKAVEIVGMPEGRIPLAQCITYLASTVKSNRAYIAIDKVREWRTMVEENGLSIEPPVQLTAKGKEEYKYPHDYENSFVRFDYLPKEILNKRKKEKELAYMPSENGIEARFKARLAELWG